MILSSNVTLCPKDKWAKVRSQVWGFFIYFSKQQFKDFWQDNKTWIKVICFGIITAKKKLYNNYFQCWEKSLYREVILV